jgi:hypothetical protein
LIQRRMRTSQPALVLALTFAALVVVAVLAVLFLLGEETTPEGPLVTVTGRGPSRPDPRIEPADGSDPDPEPRRIEAVDVPSPRLGPDMVIGRVLDADTGATVDVFQVHLMEHADTPPMERVLTTPSQPFSTRTGIFRIGRDPGVYDIVVRAPGYHPHIKRAYELPALDGRPVPFPMEHGAGIAGQILDLNRMPSRNIGVHLHVTRLDDPEATTPTRRFVKTDSEGRYRFSPLPAGNYEISLLEPDNRLDRVSGIRIDDDTVDIDLYLTPRHQIVFRVQNSAGRPVAGADVELRGGDHFSSQRTTTAGQAVMPYVPTGAYVVRVQREGFEPLEESVLLEGSRGHSVQWLTLLRAADG